MNRLIVGIVVFLLYLIFLGDLTKPLENGNMRGFLINLWFPVFVIALVSIVYVLIKKLGHDDFNVK